MSFSAKKYFDKNKRQSLLSFNTGVLKKSLLHDLRLTLDDRKKIHQCINIKLGNHTTRFKNRCLATNRAKGVYRVFGLSRIVLRSRVLTGLLPTVRKSIW